MAKLVREPLIHFLIIGAGIYALYGVFAGDDAAENDRTVTVTAGEIESLASQWTRMWNRPPTEEELAGVIRSHVRVQILHREALAMGLDVGDTVIERRLAQKVEMLAQSLITPKEPTDDELRAWYAETPDRFKQPDLYWLTHIYFSLDERGTATLNDAQEVLAELESLDELPASYEDYGDRFMLQNYYASSTKLEIGKLFGSAFADAVVELEPAAWRGPIESGYGTHLVFISAVQRHEPPSFDAVKAQLKDEWIGEKIDDLSDRFIDNLISRYDIVIEETAVPVTLPGQGATP